MWTETMIWRRRRTTPTVTELNPVQRALDRDPALSRLLGPKTVTIRKRTGEPVSFSPQTVSVAEAMMATKLNPQRAAQWEVLAAAGRVLGFLRKPSSDIALPGA
ncbi:MAG: hypothetical protein N3J91_00025 [Verrucomicrobiae bacterium]|nr:hypothetical protein [Verrucomicrobiae bacterium]